MNKKFSVTNRGIQVVVMVYRLFCHIFTYFKSRQFFPQGVCDSLYISHSPFFIFLNLSFELCVFTFFSSF
uniref:Uncharacterized protein n=1 Tax=Anguilla anguilla TaxID=7936 RepID=A0A0E9UC85_ANGAN